MMNSEIENALRQKANQWEFESTRSEVRSLKEKIAVQERKIGELEGKVSNQGSAIVNLIQLIIERGILPEDEQTLFNLKMYI